LPKLWSGALGNREQVEAVMVWNISHRADASVVPIADRHYNRQNVGSPQFAPPGSCRVLKYLADGRVAAFWITSAPFAEYVKHDWPGAWICSAFRNESGVTSSEMILDALAASKFLYGEPPELGMVTFVDPRHVPGIKVRGKTIYGYCFLKAGFAHVGYTKGGLWAWQLLPPQFPASEAPKGSRPIQEKLFA
jgi:hypothetical protein